MARNSKQLRRAFEARPFCAYCGTALSYAEYGSNYATLDHIVPKSRGGGEALVNKTLACMHCNQVKASATNWPQPTFTFADLFPRAQPDFESEDYDYAEPSE